MKFFNAASGNAEIDRLAREIQKLQPDFKHDTSVKLFHMRSMNARIDELTQTLATLQNKAGKVVAKAAAATPWAHIHDPATRTLLERAHPGGPGALAAVANPVAELDHLVKLVEGKKNPEAKAYVGECRAALVAQRDACLQLLHAQIDQERDNDKKYKLVEQVWELRDLPI